MLLNMCDEPQMLWLAIVEQGAREADGRERRGVGGLRNGRPEGQGRHFNRTYNHKR